MYSFYFYLSRFCTLDFIALLCHISMKRNLFCRKKNKAWFLMHKRKSFAKKLKRDKHLALFQSPPKLNHTLRQESFAYNESRHHSYSYFDMLFFLPNCPQLSNTLDQPTTITENVVEYNLLEVAILHKLNLQKFSSTHCKILIPCLKKYFNIFMAFLFIKCLFPSSYLIMIIIIIITYFNTMSISVII